MGKLDSGGLLEHLHRHMAGGAVAARRAVQLSFARLRQRDEVLD